MPPKRAGRASSTSKASEAASAIDSSPTTTVVSGNTVRLITVTPPALPFYTSRFFLLLLSSFTLSALCNLLTANTNDLVLASVSRRLTSTPQILTAIGVRLTELTLLYLFSFDASDVTWLSLLIHTPHLYLLHTFYLIPYQTTLLSGLATVVSVAIPFALFGRADPPTSARFTDNVTALVNSLTGAALYAIPLLAASYTGTLPLWLAVHFDGLRTLDPAHSGTLFSSAAFTLPAGYAVARFVLAPAAAHALAEVSSSPSTALRKTGPAATAAAIEEVDELRFDPAHATLTETLHYNVFFWRWHARPARILIGRAAVLAVATLAGAAAQTFVEVEGVDAVGAVGWAGLWAGAAGLSGLVFGWVGGFW